MKDQSPIMEPEDQKTKMDRAVALFIESVLKPDHALRGCAHNQKCYHELMHLREVMLEYLRDGDFRY